MGWEPGRILIILFGKPTWRDGYQCRGLGLFSLVEGIEMRNFNVAPIWRLYHLGTGHAICFVQAEAEEAFRVCAEVVELGDWTFDSLNGWQNCFPDAQQKFQHLAASYPGIFRQEKEGTQSEPLALAVLMAREGREAATHKRKPRTKRR